MKLDNACVITDDFLGLCDFYQKILQIDPKVLDGVYAVFPMGNGSVLSIYKRGEQERWTPGAVQGGLNKSIILEFGADDIEKEYERLMQMSIEWVVPPKTYPWGSVAFYFRDPDGNLVNFHTRISE